MERKLPDMIKDIINLFFTNEYDCEDKREIQKWLLADNGSAEKEKSLFQLWQSLYIKPDHLVYRSLEIVKAAIGLPRAKSVVKKKTSIWVPVLRVAAIVIPFILLIGGLSFYNHSPRGEEAPVLAQLIEISVPEGETRCVQLPDGTDVWLKSGSTIKYSEKFEGSERRVQLMGDIYLDVAKDSLKPFILSTEHLDITVLGTEFGVRAYPNEENLTVLLYEGKVNARSLSGQSYDLNPNEQLVLNLQTGEMKVSRIEKHRMFWRKGNLVFNEATFGEIIEALEHHFNILIEVDQSLLTTEYYTIKFVNNENVNESLGLLQDLLGGFSYQLKVSDSDSRQVVILKRAGQECRI